jgi:pyocin large subunit-like protein
VAGVKLSLWLLAALALFGVGCRHSNSPAPTQTPRQQPPASKDRAAGKDQSAGKDQAGANGVRAEIGFATRRKFLDHFEKHGAEFGSISREEYLRQAQILRDSPARGDILEAERADGVITRFDRKTGAFLAFNPDLTIRTYFKPNDGERYFRRQSKR